MSATGFSKGSEINRIGIDLLTTVVLETTKLAAVTDMIT
jgi:hypothetical protein